VGQEQVNRQDENLIRAVGAFGGGVASSGRVCGCLTGGIALLSSLYGKDRPEGKDHPRMWRLSYKLTKRFEDLTREYGGVDCRDIARVDWKDREAVKVFYSGPDGRRRLCQKLVGETACALGEILEQADQS
jgi:C_GCAxxG_C_C family probable redox protein